MQKHSQKRKKNRRDHKLWLAFNSVFLMLYSLISSVFLFYMYTYQFLAFRYVNVIITFLLVAVFVISLLMILKKHSKIGLCLFLLGMSIVVATGVYFLQTTIQVADKVNKTALISEIEMSVVVPVGSTIQNISEVGQLQAPINNDGEHIQAFLSDLRQNKDFTVTPEEVDSYQTAYEHLLVGETQAMVLNSAYSSLLELLDPDYSSKIRTLYTYRITKEVQAGEKMNSNVINIYVSGIDTYGSISTVSRSDVNIILTVNMNTHKILLTTTPRDAYVQIPDGGADQNDKLTHAGIYGVETSMKTLENLYDIDIQYYARINFTSFLQLIDAIGGIEVDNPQAFSVGENEFPQGKIFLDSRRALLFVRERYSLAGGDLDRGRNQQRVIAAIINRLASIDSITNFTSVINALQDSIQTNMSLETMMQLANMQLSSGSAFTVTSQSVTGTGSTGELPSYAMPSASLYMLSLNPESVDVAKQAIQNIMEGN